MRKLLFLIAFGTCSCFCYSQKTSFSVKLGSGFFSFSGEDAQDETVFYETPYYNTSAPPYGKNSRFSYTIDAVAKRVGKGKIIFGTGIGYQSLSSRTRITAITVDIISSSIFTPQWGHSDL